MQWDEAGVAERGLMATRHLVLTGPMGVGQTTVGEILALRLHRPLIDSDRQLTQRFGLTSRQIVERHGIDVLHGGEAEALRTALACSEPVVVAAAASVGDDPAVDLLISAVSVVLLECGTDAAHRAGSLGLSPAVGAARGGGGVDRAPGRASGRRRPAVVDVTDRTPDEVADLILEVRRAGIGDGRSLGLHPRAMRRRPKSNETAAPSPDSTAGTLARQPVRGRRTGRR